MRDAAMRALGPTRVLVQPYSCTRLGCLLIIDLVHVQPTYTGMSLPYSIDIYRIVTIVETGNPGFDKIRPKEVRLKRRNQEAKLSSRVDRASLSQSFYHHLSSELGDLKGYFLRPEFMYG